MVKRKSTKSLFDFKGGKLPVNRSKVRHNSTIFEIPAFYEDKPFKCKDCGAREVWTAKKQKWWYEEAGGDLEATAVLCRKCRDSRKKQKDLQIEHDAKKNT